MKRLFGLTDFEIHFLNGWLCYILVHGEADRKVEGGYWSRTPLLHKCSHTFTCHRRKWRKEETAVLQSPLITVKNFCLPGPTDLFTFLLPSQYHQAFSTWFFVGHTKSIHRPCKFWLVSLDKTLPLTNPVGEGNPIESQVSW